MPTCALFALGAIPNVKPQRDWVGVLVEYRLISVSVHTFI